MDKQTIQQYENKSEDFIERYLAKEPKRLYSLVDTFFHPISNTLDIGCASGRDLKFLSNQGLQVEGLDAVESFVKHCRNQFSELTIHHDSLPLLSSLNDEIYSNIFLSAVLMHLSRADLIEAAVNILRITKPNGRIIISIRESSADSDRESDGRLFTQISTGRLVSLFEGLGSNLLFHETEEECERQHIRWHNFVFEKSDPKKKSGIDSIQEIIIKDKKDTSYKLALLRALVEMARLENGMATYDDYRDYVYIPLKRVAFYWLKFYFPLLKEDSLRQSISHQRLAFQQKIEELPYQVQDLGKLVNDYESGDDNQQIENLLKEIAKTIKVGPMKYIGEEKYGTFLFLPKNQAKVFSQLKEIDFGLIGVPVSIWHDLMLFGHWIEDSLLIRWAKFTEKANRTEDFAHYLKLLTTPLNDERTTHDIRTLYKDQTIECVWTGQKVNQFDIDHAIPYSIWFNNDLWNLLPTDQTTNKQKKNFIPHPELVKKREEILISYWKEYKAAFPKRFNYQLQKALGVSSVDNWEKEAFLNFYQTVTRLEKHKIADTWKP